MSDEYDQMKADRRRIEGKDQHCPGCKGYHVPVGAMQPFPKCPGLPSPAVAALVEAMAKQIKTRAVMTAWAFHHAARFRGSVAFHATKSIAEAVEQIDTKDLILDATSALDAAQGKEQR
jgi:hypothetical protein